MDNTTNNNKQDERLEPFGIAAAIATGLAYLTFVTAPLGIILALISLKRHKQQTYGGRWISIVSLTLSCAIFFYMIILGGALMLFLSSQ